MSYSVMSDGGGGLASLIRPVVQPAAQTAVAPPATMQAPPSDPAPAQTTQDPLAALKASLLAQSPNADWNAGGVDRASELANILNSKGITDLSKLSLGTKDFTQQAMADYTVKDEYGNPVLDGSGNPIVNTPVDDNGNQLPGFMDQYKNMNVLQYGDQTLGNLSGMDPRWLSSGNELALSKEGSGQVSYSVQQNPDGTTSIVPIWQEDPHLKALKDLALKGAVFAGGVGAAGGFGALGGAGSGAGSGAGAAGGDALAAAAGDVGFDAGSNAIWGAGGVGAGGDALAAAQGDVGFDAGSNAIWNGSAPLGGSLLDQIKNGVNTAKTGASWIQKLQNLIGGGGGATPNTGGSGNMAALLAMLAAGGGGGQAAPVDLVANVPKFDIDAWQKAMGGPQPQGDNQQALMALLSQQKRG